MKNHSRCSAKHLWFRGDLAAIVLLSLIVVILPLGLEDGSEGWSEEKFPKKRESSPVVTLAPQRAGRSKKISRHQFSPVRFLHMNVKNYFVEEEQLRSPHEIFIKKVESREAVAASIASVHPHVVALCEIGGPAALRDLKERLKKRGCDYPYEIIVARTGEPRALGLLSMYPVSNLSQAHVKLPGEKLNEDMLRGILDGIVQTPDGRKFRFLEVHLKSRYNEVVEPISLRKREAMAVRNYLDRMMRENPGMPIAIAGDFNDGTYEAAVYIVRGSTKSPYAMQVLKPKDSRGESWTILHDEADCYFAYDHILVNKTLKSRLGRNISQGIVDIPEAARASDHRAIWVDVY